MDTALIALYILVASVNAAGVYFFVRYARDWAQLLFTPRVFIHRGNVPDAQTGCFTAELSYPTRARLLDAMLGGAFVPLGSMIGRFAFEHRAHRAGLRPDQQARMETQQARFRLLRDQQSLRSMLVPASPLPPLFPSGLTATHAGISTEKSMNGNPFYILKTARTHVNREGRFVVIDTDGRQSIGPANAAMGIKVVTRFKTIGELLVAIDNGYGLPESTVRGMRICKVTESVTEPARDVKQVTLGEARTAKLVVRLAKPGSYQLYRQGNRQQYGDLATAQVFDGLADLQHRAPQTYTNPEREVLALVEQPGRSTFTEVEIG